MGKLNSRGKYSRAIYNKAILVHLEQSGDLHFLWTVDNEGKSNRFYVSPILAKMILNDEIIQGYDRDMNNFMEVRNRGDDYAFEMLWLDLDWSAPNNHLKGRKQEFTIPLEIVLDWLNGKTVKYLYTGRAEAPRVVFHDDERTKNLLHCIQTCSDWRRAFSKAMRDCFQWHGDVVTLYADGTEDFYFTSKSGYPMNGGLIFSKTLTKGRLGLKYSVHT